MASMEEAWLLGLLLGLLTRGNCSLTQLWEGAACLQGLPCIGWGSLPCPGCWLSQVMGGGGYAGQLAESRPQACQAAYSNSGPQGPSGLPARAGGRREQSLAWDWRGWMETAARAVDRQLVSC